jgi:gliding motility-associated-like protein
VDTACVTVYVELPCPDKDGLAVPNAFSPNADAMNDEFCLLGWDRCIEDFRIYIYNRWGEKVFESKDPNFCWDGKYNTTVLDAQVFVYYLEANFTNFDQKVIKKGNISLIR